MSHNTYAAPATTANPLPRFAGDWITAWLDYDPGTGLLQLGAGPSEWLLEALAPEKLASALDGRGPTEVQFNPELSILLLPGAFTAAGTSFFRLRD
ncbi:hypothetical protein ACFY5D_20590 [Paeniglutamicibacter sp. NPDC012692]|uniref:hypothetical protein n=1 Tax=Paeniglutamicibacter sp. NPDC012692 TaxID=3364388 RepID=UPI00369DA550